MSCRSVTWERVQVCTVIKSEERVLGDCFMFVRLVLGVMSGVCLWGEWFGAEDVAWLGTPAAPTQCTIFAMFHPSVWLFQLGPPHRVAMLGPEGTVAPLVLYVCVSCCSLPVMYEALLPRCVSRHPRSNAIRYDEGRRQTLPLSSLPRCFGIRCPKPWA